MSKQVNQAILKIMVANLHTQLIIKSPTSKYKGQEPNLNLKFLPKEENDDFLKLYTISIILPALINDLAIIIGYFLSQVIAPRIELQLQ